MNFDIAKFIGVSARVSGAVLFACCLTLFFPATWLPFDIEKFRSDNGIWIFLVFVLSAAIWASYFVKWIADFFKQKIKNRKIWKNYEYILKRLSTEEKMFLKSHYENRTSAISLNLQNPVHKRLQTFQVISISAGTNIGHATSMPGFIQPWVFDLLDKKPEYLKIDVEEQINE